MLDSKSLLTIHQFSEMTGTPDSTLRYYDEKGLLKPASRGRNNYRYYLPQQIASLNIINVLAELGVPLAQIAALMKNRTSEGVLGLLLERERELDKELRKLQSTYALIHVFESNILSAGRANMDIISLETRKGSPIELGAKIDWEAEPMFHRNLAAFYKHMSKKSLGLHYPMGGLFLSFESFEKVPALPDFFFSLDPNGNGEMEGGKYATGFVKGGHYERLGPAAERLRNFAAGEGRKLAGKVYVTYLLDEVTQMDESEYVAQVCAKLV